MLAWREAIAGAGITAVTLALNWWAGTDAPARRTRGTDTDGVEHLRAVHDTLVDGIVTMNAGGTICSVNPAMTRIFGYAAEEMVGQPVALLMPPEVAQQHGDYVRRQQKDAPSRVIGTGREETARRKDGDVFPISLAVSRMTIGGEPMFTGVIRDISQRRMAERAVQETNRLLALAEELAHVGHWYLRPDTGTLTWSEECYRIHGLLPGAEIPVLDTIIMLLHPDDRVAVALSIRRALDTGQGFEMEARLELPAGGLRTLRLKVVAEAPEGDGRSRGLVGIVQDITQRRAAEAALNASLERFHDYARAASDWFWEMDGEQRFTYVSDRFQSATGLDSGFLVGRFYREVAEADPASLVWQAHLDDLAHTRPIKDFVFTVRRPDGPRRHFRVSG
ncbi:MAG TPA: PAS domain S-box protein, partial [Azospirillaceae bacterium]|nr:PAS domain S-box protein [Azospirillaceae bacterium]